MVRYTLQRPTYASHANGGFAMEKSDDSTLTRRDERGSGQKPTSAPGMRARREDVADTDCNT